MGRPNSSRLSLTSLHDAARKGDSRSLQRLIAIIDPTAADKVATVLQERDSRTPVTNSAAGTDPPLQGKKLKGPQNVRGGPQTRVARGKPDTAKKAPASPLKRLLQKQDAKRRTALYVACAAGNTAVADTLLEVGASIAGHGAWQKTPLHIAAYQGHTSAIRSLLGAGADPWAVNGRGQTPSEVSYMYNPNGQVLDLLEQAVDMRTVISTGTGGLLGATFVHDDGQVVNVAAVMEQWSFMLEVELDNWKMGNRSGAKVYIPMRGFRHHTSKRPSSDNLTASTGNSKASSAQPLPERCGSSIPWLAKTVGRMRLKSDGLVKVDAGSLIGATANTPVGRGTVISVRDVSVRCEVKTVRVNDEHSIGEVTARTTSTRYDSTGDGTNFDAGEGQRTLSANDTRGYHHVRPTAYDSFSSSVVERGPTSSPGSLSEDGSNLPRDGRGGHNEDSAEAQRRGKRQPEYCEHVLPARTVGLHERITRVATKKGPPGEKSGAYCQVGENGRKHGCDDDIDESDAWDGCSEGTEKAAASDEWAATAAHERTRDDFEPEQVGAGSWTAHEGAASHTRRHAFLDNLVPLAALEGVVDCQTLPPSATTRVSRARKCRLLAQGNSRVPASPATPSATLASYPICQQHSATPQRWPKSAMLEADDLLHLIVDQELSPGSTKGHAGASGNDAYIEIVGLEEQIEREDCSGERLDKKRINMEATRSAVVEALVLWGSKADLLQARLVVVRTMANTASSASGPTTFATASTSKNNTMSLEEYLASPSPRCCACDKREGYWQEKSTEPLMPPSETSPTIAVRASPETVGGDAAVTRISVDDDGQSSTNDRGLSACYARENRCHDDSVANGDDARRCSMNPREEQLVAHLQECHMQMAHLRDWLRLLDQELG